MRRLRNLNKCVQSEQGKLAVRADVFHAARLRQRLYVDAVGGKAGKAPFIIAAGFAVQNGAAVAQIAAARARHHAGMPRLFHPFDHAQHALIVRALRRATHSTIDGVTETISAGGGYIVPSGKVHGVKALTAGRLIDTFTPRREDFL